MSQQVVLPVSLNDVNLSKTFDPRVTFDEKRSFSVLQGVQSILPQVDVATSSSNNNVQHNIISPSPDSVLDRKLYLKWYVQLTIVGTSPAGTLLQLGTNDALRANPISAMIATAQTTINGTSYSTELNEYVQPLMRYYGKEDENTRASLSPSMPDQYQTYSDYSIFGAAKNPLALYGANSAQDPRGAYLQPASVSAVNVISDNGTTAVIQFVITEPFRLSPFSWDQEDGPGLVGVQTLRLNLTLGDFSRMWSHAYSGTYTMTSITGLFYQKPELLYSFLTVNEASIQYSPQKKYVYPFHDIQRYVTNGAAVVKGASSSTKSNNIQLNYVPDRMYVFVRQTNNDLLNTTTAWYNSDAYASISNLNITFNNVSGILASASQQQLYTMSVKNGLHMSWPQFSRFCGSPICIDFGSDIALGAPILSPGVGGTFQLTVHATYTNPITTTNTTPATTINYDLYVIIIGAGTISVMGTRYNNNVGILSREDVIASMADPNLPIMKFSSVRTVYGGSFWSGLKDGFTSVWNVVKPLARAALPLAASAASLAAPQFAPAIGVASNVANSLLGNGITGGAVLGGRRKRRTKAEMMQAAGYSGGALSGGAMIRDYNKLMRLMNQ